MLSIKGSIDRAFQFSFKILLFISSYIPLFTIIFLKNINNLEIAMMMVIVFIAMPLLVIRKYISNPLKYEANKPIIISSFVRTDNEILNYIAAYIIPLIAFNSDVVTKEGINLPNLLGVIILFSVICNLYMKAGMYYINPILNLFYDILAIKTDKDESVIILTDKGTKLPINKVVITRKISPGIFLHTESRKNAITITKICILLITLIILLYIWNNEFKNFSNYIISHLLRLLHL